MFLTNWLMVTRIVAASVIEAVDYPTPEEFFLAFDGTNTLFMYGGSKDTSSTSNVAIYYDGYQHEMGNAYPVVLSEPGEYKALVDVCGTRYLTEAVTVSGISETPIGNTVSFSKGSTTWPAQLIITDLQILDVDDNVLNIEHFYFPFTNGGSTSNKEYIYSTDTDFSSITNGTYTTDDSAYINSDGYRVLVLSSTTANSYDTNTVFMKVKAFDGQADIAKVRIIYSRADYKQNVIISLDTKTYETSTGTGNAGLDETYTLVGGPSPQLTYNDYNKLTVANTGDTNLRL